LEDVQRQLREKIAENKELHNEIKRARSSLGKMRAEFAAAMEKEKDDALSKAERRKKAEREREEKEKRDAAVVEDVTSLDADLQSFQSIAAECRADSSELRGELAQCRNKQRELRRKNEDLFARKEEFKTALQAHESEPGWKYVGVTRWSTSTQVVQSNHCERPMSLRGDDLRWCALRDRMS
jgi:chromosome segregation ATPase